MDITFAVRGSMVNAKAGCEKLSEEHPMLFECDQVFKEFKWLIDIDVNYTLLIYMESNSSKIIALSKSKSKSKNSEMDRIFQEFEDSGKRKNDKTACRSTFPRIQRPCL